MDKTTICVLCNLQCRDANIQQTTHIIENLYTLPGNCFYLIMWNKNVIIFVILQIIIQRLMNEIMDDIV